MDTLRMRWSSNFTLSSLVCVGRGLLNPLCPLNRNLTSLQLCFPGNLIKKECQARRQARLLMAEMTPAWCIAVDWGAGGRGRTTNIWQTARALGFSKSDDSWIIIGSVPLRNEKCWNYRVVAEKLAPTGYEVSKRRETSATSQTVPRSLCRLHCTSWCSQGLSQGSKMITAPQTIFLFWTGWH